MAGREGQPPGAPKRRRAPSPGGTARTKPGIKLVLKEKAAPPPLIIGGVSVTIRQLLGLGGGIVVLAALGLWFWMDSSPEKGPPPAPATQADVLGLKPLAPPSTSTAAPLPPPSPDGGPALPAIQQVRLSPSQPTLLDTLKVEVSTASPEPLTYLYVWKVNDRVVAGATGNSLNLSGLKKLDVVTVTVTPTLDGRRGFAVESPFAAIHSAPPTLELKGTRQVLKPGAPIELNLAARDPDGDAVSFSLEPPLVPGMTIDRSSGRILWTPAPGQKGTVRFGAGAEDVDGNKTTGVFEVTLP